MEVKRIRPDAAPRDQAAGSRALVEFIVCGLPAVGPVRARILLEHFSLEDRLLHLSYALEQPRKSHEVQQALRIAPEAGFALSIKNPEKGQPPGAGLAAPHKADYPDKLKREFRDRRFAREDARLLDVENAEFLLVGARADPNENMVWTSAPSTRTTVTPISCAT